MSAAPRLILKQPTGWFAAGREVAEALTLLPDPVFRLYMYLCLNADRHTGRFVIDPVNLARVLGRNQPSIEEHLSELRRRGVCHRRVNVVEICDRFWPYQKRMPSQQDGYPAEYLRQVKEAFLEPACVCSAFTPADEKLAVDLFRRGVPLDNLRRAIWLGCARKYIAMLNGPPGQPRVAIASLGYFTALLDEVADAPVSDIYWGHVRQKMQMLERRWLPSSSSTTATTER
jgi:hypothetical protein